MSLFNAIIITLVAFSSATDAIDSADVGLNANLILADSVITSSVCNKGFVDCRNGDEVIDGAITWTNLQAVTTDPVQSFARFWRWATMIRECSRLLVFCFTG